ncbi:2124_t:CDS:2, partial [Ambispora leptoticha]
MIHLKFILSFFAIISTTSYFVSSVPHEKRGQYSGDGTFYNPGVGACGQTSGAGSFIAAINKPQWGNPANPNSNPICGKQATVTGPKGSTTVTILDLCPECAFGSLDLSPAAFNAIADPNAGRVPISWDFV